MASEYGPPGDPTCWLGNINFETCCLPPPRGNDHCWEGGFTYERCCRRNPNEPVDINKVAEISELGGCELNIFQEFKERAGGIVFLSVQVGLSSCALLRTQSPCRCVVPRLRAKLGALPGIWLHLSPV